MDYRDFINYIKEQMHDSLGDEAHVELHQIIKNNGVRKDGLTIIEEGGNLSPTIYLNEYFSSYQSGRTIKEIVEEIAAVYEENKREARLDTEFYKDYEKVKKSVACKLINYDKNKALLDEIPHIRYLDLAVVFYYMMQNETIGSGTILIYNNHLDMWGISAEMLYETARRNTLDLLPYQMQSMQEVLNEMMGESQLEQDSNDIPMFVLSNRNKSLGAVYILYDSVLAEIGEILKKNYYILPSSIHECIIVTNSVETTREQLTGMVCEINETQVLPEEVLSDNIYYYIRESHKLSIVSEG